MRVVVSVRPLHMLTQELMQGIAEPSLLLNQANSPHDASLKPSDIRTLQQADVIFWVGKNYEQGMIRALGTLQNPERIHTLSAIKNLKNQENDPHIWLDADNALLITRAMADILAARWPEHSQRLEKNAATLMDAIRAGDAEARQLLTPLQAIAFFALHDGYSRLAARYGLRYLGAVSPHSHTSATAQQWQAMGKKARAEKATCMIIEPNTPTKTLNIINKSDKFRQTTLDIEAIAETLPTAGYPDWFARQIRLLQRCLKQEP